MKISKLLSLELGENISVLNQPFHFVGKAEVTLDDGTVNVWYYNDQSGLLTISAEEEEFVSFEHIEEELEPEANIILFQGKEYEFTYENAGKITNVEGDLISEEEDRYMFSDYDSADGEKVRLVKNENTGESMIYKGNVISEDDISEL